MYTTGFEQVTFRHVMKLYTTTRTYRFNVSRMSHVKFVDLYQEFADLYQKHADLFTHQNLIFKYSRTHK